MGGLEVGEVLAGEGAEIGFGGGGAGAEDDEGVRGLAPLLVGQADDGGLLDGGVAEERGLDLDGGDVLAAADDDVLHAIADLDVAVGVDDGGVAAVEEAAGEGGGGGVGIGEVAGHDDVAAHDDLAEGGAVARDGAHVLVDDAELAGGDELDALAGLDPRALGEGQGGVLLARLADGDEGGGLGEAVDVGDGPAELALDALDGGAAVRTRRPRGAAARSSAGAPAIEISTVGAQQRAVMRSRAIRSKMAAGSTLRRQTCVPPAAVTIQTNVQPLAWNMGSVHR